MPNDIRNQTLYVGSTGDPESYAADAHPYLGQLGQKMTIINPPRSAPGSSSTEDGRSRTYQLVQGDSTMTTAPFPGAVMWWKDKSKYQVSTLPTATSRGNIAGVCKASPGKGQTFYIQTEGPCLPVKVIDASALAVAVGESCIPSSTAGKADRVAAGTAPTYPTLGLYASTCDPNAEALVDLNVPGTP